MNSHSILDKENNNSIITSPKTSLDKTKISIKGRNNKIQIEENCNLRNLNIKVIGDHNNIQISSNVVLSGNITVALEGDLYIGKQSTFGKVDILCENANIYIGDDCMFSYGIEIRSSDTHPIYSLVNYKRINTTQNIFVGDYVWCGKKVNIMKGAHIGHGCIIGLGAVVTNKSFPNFCTLVGIPAKVIKEDTIWTRHTRNEILKEDKVAMYYIEKYTKVLV